MRFELMKNEHGAVISHVALALGGVAREDSAKLIASPQMALILKDEMSVKELMTAISSMVMNVSELTHRLAEMCEPQCEDCDYGCISDLLNSAVDSACMDIAKQYSSGNEQTMDNAYEAATSVLNSFIICRGCLKALLKQYIEEDACGK